MIHGKLGDVALKMKNHEKHMVIKFLQTLNHHLLCVVNLYNHQPAGWNIEISWLVTRNYG